MSKRTFEPDWLWSPVQGRHFIYNGWQNQYNYTRMVATPKELPDWDDFLAFPFLFPTEKWPCAPSAEGCEQSGAQGWVWETSAELWLSWHTNAFSVSSNMHEMARDVSWGLHTDKLNPGATPTLTAEHLVPSGYQTELFETGHYCRSKMIQYPPQQSSQQFYF